MSFASDLKQAIRNSLAELSTDIKDRDASDVIFDLERNLTSDALAKAIEPVLYLNEEKAERLNTERCKALVDDLGDTVAEAIAYDALKEARLIRAVSRELEDVLVESMGKFQDICSEYEDADRGRRDDRGRGRDRDRNSEVDRRDRKRERSRSGNDQRQEGRHVNGYDRDEDPERVKEAETRRSRRRSTHDEQSAPEEVTVTEVQIKNGEVITADNYPALPPICRDVPFYYAGLEQLSFKDGLIHVNVIEDSTKVDYEKHRTDLFLSNNRDQVHPGKTIENLEKALKEASATKVNAYITATTNKGTAEEGTEEIINAFKIDKSCIVSGVYNLTNDAWNCETQVREAMIDMIGDKFSEKLVGVTFRHTIFTAKEDVVKSESWKEFKDMVDTMAIDTRIVSVRDILQTAQKFLDVKGYNSLHAIYNAAVCNALSCSLKLGISTKSILADWDDIENLIQEQHAENPYVIALINSNLSSSLPSLIIDDDGAVMMLRNYIFLPVSKNELGIASPLRYATINKSIRPELYGCINKLLITNVPSDSFKALTTLVTLEDESLTLFSNRDMLGDSGYYVFRPI